MKDYSDMLFDLREEMTESRYANELMKRAADVIEQLAKDLNEALVDVRHAEEYAWEVKQERDALAKSLDQTLVRLNDETVRADRLEAENRAKEQYIAETIGKLTRERERDDEIIASLQKELVEAAKERDAAIAFVPRVCKTCKRDGLQYLAGGKLDGLCDTCRRNRRCNWEWRGVQEVAK